MKKNLLFLLLLILLNSCKEKIKIEYYENGQVKIKCETDKEGRKHGNCEEYYESGDLKSISTWKLDSLQGNLTTYYEGGEVSIRMVWSHGVIEDTVKHYYRNGILKLTTPFKRGKKVGLEKVYFLNGGLEQINEWVYAQGINFINSATYFNEMGDTVFQSHYVAFNSKQDTIALGEKYEFELELKNPIFDNLYVVYGDFDEDFNLNKGKMDTFWLEGLTMRHSVPAERTGENFLRLILIDNKQNYDSLNRLNTTFQPLFFSKKYYVR
jgi:hypothetical protein